MFYLLNPLKRMFQKINYKIIIYNSQKTLQKKNEWNDNDFDLKNIQIK